MGDLHLEISIPDSSFEKRVGKEKESIVVSGLFVVKANKDSFMKKTVVVVSQQGENAIVKALLKEENSEKIEEEMATALVNDEMLMAE